MFRIFSSGKFYRYQELSASATGGEGYMSAVLETSDRHVDGVSVFVDPF